MRYAILIALCAWGCDSEGAINPAPRAPATGEPTAKPHPPAGPVVRTVETRNPWGGPAGNLMADGDFEFSIVLEGSSPQAGWNAFANNNLTYLRGLTGGMCKSGLRCAVVGGGGLGGDTGLLGKGTSAKGSGMIGEAWAKVPAGATCDAVQFLFYHCSYNDNFGRRIDAVSVEPDADGWCRYRGGIAEQDEAVCLQITSTVAIDQEVVIDAVSLIPDDGTVTQRKLTTIDSRTSERLRVLTKKLRDLTPFGKSAPARPPLGDDS